jgi:hypothetical protein
MHRAGLEHPQLFQMLALRVGAASAAGSQIGRSPFPQCATDTFMNDPR